MFILEILLGLKSKQGDALCAFLHGELEPGENVYVEMPLGFSLHSKDGTIQVLKLKKTLYGLRQSPRAFWKYITEKLKACELEQSKFDPVSLLEPKGFVLSMLRTSSFGVKTQRISIAQQCNCVSLVSTLNRKTRCRVSWSHIGMGPRNRFA